MRLEQQLAIDVGNLDGLVDEPHLGAARDQRKERGDVLRIHADAAVRDRHSNGHRIVGAVDHVGAVTDGEPQGEVAQRIVRARRHHLRQRIAALGVLLADGLRRIPGGVSDLGDDAGLTERCAPVHLADAHRIGDDHRALGVFRLRVVIQPVLGDVDHDPFPRARRQNAPPGQQDLGALARQPHVDVGVGANDFLVPEAVAPRDIEERVLIGRLDPDVAPDHRRAVLRHLVDGRPHWSGDQADAEQNQSPCALHVISVKVRYTFDFT